MLLPTFLLFNAKLKYNDIHFNFVRLSGHTSTTTNKKFQVICFISFSLLLLKDFNFLVN